LSATDSGHDRCAVISHYSSVITASVPASGRASSSCSSSRLLQLLLLSLTLVSPNLHPLAAQQAGRQLLDFQMLPSL